ncbi:hypothetical protein [Gordonia sp. SL306]|uniref:hypothetical protein n=1 Tax=Gordonia sp. SL306 TaxID=2995145 RepID=UPI00226FD2B4|nr:hypothetical protein [Gordonia sp. SL306]WAC55025.1 hypothetical protein OVA31_20690 [Gordonia sp. SL306]
MHCGNFAAKIVGLGNQRGPLRREVVYVRHPPDEIQQLLKTPAPVTSRPEYRQRERDASSDEGTHQRANHEFEEVHATQYSACGQTSYGRLMSWILEPRDNAGGHVLVNRTGNPAHDVTVTALDDAADAWHPARPPYAPAPHASIGLDVEVQDGDDVGGWRFGLGADPAGIVEIRWSDTPGAPPSLAARIDAGASLESYEI